MATIQSLEAEYQSLLAERDVLAAKYQDGDFSVLTQIQVINARIREVLRQLDNLQQFQNSPDTNSSGSIVSGSQNARDDGANIQNPEVSPLLLPTAQNSNSTEPNNNNGFNIDIGTDGRIRTLTETQANPAPTSSVAIGSITDSEFAGLDTTGGSGAFPSGTSQTTGGGTDPYDFESNGSITPTNTPGVGSGGDDSATQPAGTAPAGNIGNTSPGQINPQAQLANKTDRAVVAQDNILDKFASYTYTVSIYLMSPEDYQRIMSSKKRFIPGSRLLIQSAGAPVKAGNQTTSSSFSEGSGTDLGTITTVANVRGRNQFFPQDFYIDDIEIKSINPGKGTNGAHNVTELKFKIVEPNGITLLDRLNNAVQDYIDNRGGASVGTSNGQFGAQNYLMVIRFYGYDANGSLLTAQQISSVDPTKFDKTDANAIVEKFIPFQFSGIKFRIANRLVEYDCSAVAVPNIIGTAQGRGTIPYNVQFTATTLQNLFNGNAAYINAQNPDQNTRDNARATATQAPSTAPAAPTPTVVQGLTQALNTFQAEQVKSGTYTYADVYKVVLSHQEIANSSIVPPGETNRQSKPMTNPTTAAAAKDGARQSVQNNAKTVSAIAGTSIIQFLDQAVQRSEYIYKQQTKIKGTDKNGNEIDIPQSTAGRAFAWYTINIQATPFKDKFDPKRNDYAYEITYEIAPYAVNQVLSDYFPKGRFRGVQKRYPYWFTGENTSVLNFEQSFDYLYYVTVNSRQSAPVSVSNFNYAVAEKRVFSPNSGQSSQGIEGNINEPAANAADYLYSPGDQGQVKLTILGDPAWIMQGTLWSGVRSTSKTTSETYDPYFDAFLADGTINYDAREVLFEVAFNKPNDYDLDNGLMKGT